MTQPIKYMTLALQMINIYQQELMKHLRKSNIFVILFVGSVNNLLEFKKIFDQQITKIINIQSLKAIQQDTISKACQSMIDFLDKSVRIKKTSQSDRYNYRSNLVSRQQSHRMRMTDGFANTKIADAFKPYQKEQRQSSMSELEEIIQSYKISDNGPGPKSSRMKWRNSSGMGQGSPKIANKSRNQVIGSNNLQILNATIPQIQNRIKHLSDHNSRKSPNGKSFLQRQREGYRTLQSRGHSFRRYIPRLF